MAQTSRLGTKLVRITTLVLALIMATGIVWNIYSENKQAQAELLEQGRVLAAEILALREVAAENQYKINYDSKGSFEFKHLNPSALTQQVSRVFNSKTRYIIRQTSLKPRISENRPDAFEREKLIWFGKNRDVKEAWGEKVIKGERYFTYMVPLRIEPACLACHGEPKGEIDVSGNPKEGYKIGDLAGALTVSIPTKTKVISLTRTIRQNIILTVVAIVFSGIVIVFHTNRFVTTPISSLSRFSQELGQGNLQARPAEFKAYGEIQELTLRFTEMANRLQEMYDNLEQKVIERTQELAAANNDLARISQYKSEFLANMSHELRTPLTAILAFTEGLLNKSKGQLTPEQEDYLTEIKDSGKLLLGIINDLLDLSKIESRKMSLDLEEVSVGEVVRRIDKLLKPLAERKGVQVRLNLAGTQTVIADEEKVGHVVRNLLSNAIKFSPEGGLIEVAVTDDGEKEGVVLSVKDSGPGISQQDQELIFESFYQAGRIADREFKGYGLGLALVKKIVDLHLGWIKVESRLGEGSAFNVFWPAYPLLDDILE